MKRSDRGLTLIELLAAMAILATVSLMAVQTLSGALFQREVLSRADEQAADLIRALTLLRRDLEAAVPVPLEVGDLPSPAFDARLDGFALMRGGLGAGADRIGRVDWQVSASGQLIRRVRVAADDSGLVPVLEDVSALRLNPLQGGASASDNPTDLPAGFELTFDHTRHGALRLVVAR